jgi:hypothetical protein
LHDAVALLDTLAPRPKWSFGGGSSLEQMLIALQRAGRIDLARMIELQARYLREISE